MGFVQWIVVAVALARLAELAHSHRNQARLLERGGHELGAGHYPLIVLLHAAWLAALFFGVPGTMAPNWMLLGGFLVLQGLRVWIIASLGPYWTTRVITVPGEQLSRRGPYRWMRHPNYAVVAAEIAVLPLAFGAWQIALGFSLANAGLLAWRIAIENRALDERAGAGNSH
jgi:methyltransferase